MSYQNQVTNHVLIIIQLTSISFRKLHTLHKISNNKLFFRTIRKTINLLACKNGPKLTCNFLFFSSTNYCLLIDTFSFVLITCILLVRKTLHSKLGIQQLCGLTVLAWFWSPNHFWRKNVFFPFLNYKIVKAIQSFLLQKSFLSLLKRSSVKEKILENTFGAISEKMIRTRLTLLL